jgi:hypothetical protein
MHEKITINQFFKLVPEDKFSMDFLEKVCDHLAVLEIPNLYLSDWGEEQRIAHNMEKFHLSFTRKSVHHTTALDMLSAAVPYVAPF